MRLVNTREASALTGLTVDQLREWTIRRALIPADVRPRSHGSPARFAWQTLLILRIASSLKSRFHLELPGHVGLFASLRSGLEARSFLTLRGRTLALLGGDAWDILDDVASAPRSDGLILLNFDPRLDALAGCGAVRASAATQQLQLFPVTGLRTASVNAAPGGLRHQA